MTATRKPSSFSSRLGYTLKPEAAIPFSVRDLLSPKKAAAVLAVTLPDLYTCQAGVRCGISEGAPTSSSAVNLLCCCRCCAPLDTYRRFGSCPILEPCGRCSEMLTASSSAIKLSSTVSASCATYKEACGFIPQAGYQTHSFLSLFAPGSLNTLVSFLDTLKY